MQIPKQYLPVMPYLILSDMAGFLSFVKNVFEAKEQLTVPGADERSIMHGEIRIGEAVIMFGGANDQWQDKPAGMFLYVEDLDSVYSKAISNGAKVLVEPNVQEYGYTAGVEDPFGNQWWITQGEK